MSSGDDWGSECLLSAHAQCCWVDCHCPLHVHSFVLPLDRVCESLSPGPCPAGVGVQLLADTKGLYTVIICVSSFNSDLTASMCVERHCAHFYPQYALFIYFAEQPFPGYLNYALLILPLQTF